MGDGITENTIQKIRRLREENERLKDGLRIFARRADEYSDSYPGNCKVIDAVTLDECRRARSLLRNESRKQNNPDHMQDAAKALE